MATRATMVSNVRLFIKDTSSVGQSFTDAQLTTFINLALRWLYENYEKRIKYATIVADWDASVSTQNGDATCIYPEIIEVFHVESTGLDLTLKELPWGELRYRQNLEAEGSPVYYAKLKYGGAAVGSGLQNLWKFALLPIPSTANHVLKALVRDYPVALSADADIVDLGDFEAQLAEIIASIFAAPRMGRPDLAADLMGLLPKMLQDKLDTHRSREEVTA